MSDKAVVTGNAQEQIIEILQQELGRGIQWDDIKMIEDLVKLAKSEYQRGYKDGRNNGQRG